jgi:hypothetical protein
VVIDDAVPAGTSAAVEEDKAVPADDAPWPEILEFCHQFNAYEHWGSSERCGEIGNESLETFQRTGDVPSDSIIVRTCLFFESRRWSHTGYGPYDEEHRPYVAALLSQLRPQ